MKLLPLLLATSIAANAAWLVTTVLHDSGNNAQDRLQTSKVNISGSTPTGGELSPQKPGAIEATQPLAIAINSNDPETLFNALRAAGVDEDIVRQLVASRIWKNYESRFKALRNQTEPDASIWWKNPENFRHGNQTKEQREESRRLQQEVQAENERLLGPADKSGTNVWIERKYGFLSPDKRTQLQKTEQDYNELMGEINNETQGFQLPSDREQLRYLEEEKERDIQALLTPEELRAYELRNSQTAQQLRWKMTKMDASEAEYLQIFDLQKKFDDIYNPPNNSGQQIERDQAYWKERREAEKELNAQIHATIGDERYSEYVLSNDHGYQQVQAAVRRLDLPEDTPRKIYALRTEIPAAAVTIADDSSLSYEQKTTQLVALAETARNQIRVQLGSEAAEVIFKNGSFRWIEQLEKGNITIYDTDGQQSTRRLPKPPAVKKP